MQKSLCIGLIQNAAVALPGVELMELSSFRVYSVVQSQLWIDQMAQQCKA